MRRVALVTGAGRGLGEAIARRLHADGCAVAVLDLDGDAARQLASELDASGASALGVAADVQDAASLEQAITQVEQELGSVDILVNNAGRTVARSVWDIELDEWDAVLETNLRSVFIATRRCAPAMRDRGWGRIINMSSLAGQQGGLVAGAHYAASKAGILVVTKVFAKELAAHGVTVNSVAPAATRTPVMDEMSPEAIARSEASIPVGRLGRPDETAALVSYLASDDAGFVTGATLDINGGVFMR